MKRADHSGDDDVASTTGTAAAPGRRMRTNALPASASAAPSARPAVQRKESGHAGWSLGGVDADPFGVHLQGPSAAGDAASPALVRAGAELTGGGPADPASTAAIAARGVAGASERLPHHDRIQASFGHHDLGGLAVARDGAAAAASAQIGAQAYTLGDRVALPAADLRIEAHEAAHVIQQRAGRVAAQGTPGDPHERHADAVADRVVAGESAVALLDELAGDGGGAGPGDDQLQLFNTADANIVARWGYAVAPGGGAAPSPAKATADVAFAALRVRLLAYEVGASIATAEGVLDAASAFVSAFQTVPVLEQGGNPGRVTAQAKALVDEAHRDLHAQMQTVATTPNGGRTDAQLVDDAVGQLGPDADRRRDRKRILRHEQEIGMRATELVAVTDADGPAILQSWRARGDMYHVGAVLNLFPQLKVILYDLPAPGGIANAAQADRERERAERWDQACVIADYYGQPARVFFTRAEGVAARADKGHAYEFKQRAGQGAAAAALQGLFIDVGGCTTILGLDLAEARTEGRLDQRKQELAQAVAPSPVGGDGRADTVEVQTYLAAHNWVGGTKYVLINFRDSGHAHIQKKIAAAPVAARPGVIAGYDPVRDQVGGNHPELDTGTAGVQQLADLVRARGFTPVFMGDEPAGAPQPHLIKYWDFTHVYGGAAAPQKVCRGGRAAEAFFMRVVAETYDVRLLSMRSGVTDQLAFLGIPTISIDVDNFHQAAAPELAAEPGYQLGDDETAHSWARGTKLEAGLERDYGRVFLSEQRELNEFDAHGKWAGTIGDQDLATVDSALGLYFGTAAADAPATGGVRHESHPFHPGKMAKTEATGDADALHQAASGKIETGLNPETVLAHMRSVLGAAPPKVAEAQRFADSQLAFMEEGDSRVDARNVGHRTGKLAQRRSFLDSVIALLEPHGAVGKYQSELDELEGLARVNGPRRVRLEKASAALRLAMDIRMLDHKDKKVATYFAQLDGVQLGPIDAALAEAKAACSVERAAIHTTRLDAIAAQLATAFATVRDAVTAAVEEHGAESYYGRFFQTSKTRLAAVQLE